MSTISIKPIAGTKLKVKSVQSADEHLTALEIVKQTQVLKFTLLNGANAMRGFAPLQRDTVSTTPSLKMWGTDILYYEERIDGSQTSNLILQTDFLEAKNCLLISYKGDTLAYIPNSILRDSETKIKTLFSAKDYEPILKIFNDAYTFIPVTGTEYLALKANNQQ